MPFAAFMDAALYDPEGGFFVTSPAGREFATSPHISRVFAACVASVLARVRAAVPDASFVELGAADGTLAAQILASLPPSERDIGYLAIEQDPAARNLLLDRALGYGTVAASPALPDHPLRGLVFANELFDNIPFHRFRLVDGAVREVAVTFADDRFVEKLIEPTLHEPTAPQPGREAVVSPRAHDLLRAVCDRIECGYLIVVDYGDAGDGEGGPVRGYRDHGFVKDVLDAPGSCDITGPVDFLALRAVAATAGLAPAIAEGITTQRVLLHLAGYRRFVDDLAARQQAAEAAGDHRKALALWNARGEATFLVDEGHLGGLKALAMRTPDLPMLG